MIGRPSDAPAPKGAKLWRKSWTRKPSSFAAFRTALNFVEASRPIPGG
jgi:hypothetical protein